ncbi:MAG TPA: helix-turn-helix transcriptional regulator [Phenylobacterium sp.]|nr:helix-turn-helix transcriptional regulator [Phenylobacterium sp.]
MDLNGASSAEILVRRRNGRAALLPRATTQEVQAAIGLAIRRRRRLIDMTLRDLADACDVSFQQIHKYEAGQCSVSAVQLWRIGCALGVPITYFFEGLKTLDKA